MNTLMPFVLSGLLPGTGQIYLGKYLKGFLMLIIPFIILYFVSRDYFLLAYFSSVIISLTEIYIEIKTEKGRYIARKNLFFALSIIIVIIPATIYIIVFSLFKGTEFTQEYFLNEKNTKQEMVEVSMAIDRYYSRNKLYPPEYGEFVNKRPTTSHWSHDKWGNEYKYELTEKGYVLTSAGKDQEFGTEDDLIRSNQ
jgi:hypothetical protein